MGATVTTRRNLARTPRRQPIDLADRAGGEMEYSVRDYVPATDWGQICRVHDLARPLELSGSCDARAFVPLEQDPESEEIAACRMWVSCDNTGTVVGFSGVHEQYIAWLYVDPCHQGHGVGRRLLRQALAVAGPEAWTIALAGNNRALALYRSEGFDTAHTFESDNAGYPCICVRLQRGG